MNLTNSIGTCQLQSYCDECRVPPERQRNAPGLIPDGWKRIAIAPEATASKHVLVSAELGASGAC